MIRVASLLLAGLALATTSSLATDEERSAALRGMVVDDRGAPVDDARLTVYDTTAPQAPVAAAVSDGAGRWAFVGLAAGRYGLIVARAGHATTDVSVPESVPIADGQTRDLTIRLVRTGVIEGVVLDEFHEPLPGVTVYGTAVPFDRTARASAARSTTTTTSNGRFRLHGLMPGEYLISARPDRARAPVRAPSGQLVSTIETYYPGTTSASRAAPVAVTAGSEATGIALRLDRIPVGPIEIDMVNTSGQEIDRAFAEWRAVDGSADFTDASGDAALGDDGRLVLTDVPAGFHVVSVRALVEPRPGEARPLPVWGWGEVATAATHERVSIPLAPGSTITARVAVDGTAVLAGVARLLPRLVAVSSPFSDQARNWIRSRPLPFGFEISGVPPGDYRLDFTGLPENVAPLSAVVDGEDVLDGVLRIASGRDVEGLVVTLTDRAGSIAGLLTDAAGAPRFDLPIVVFPADAAHRTTGSRRVVRTTPDIDGRFEIRKLPPGDYFVAATDPGWNPRFDPAGLAQLESAAERVRLELGQRASVRLSRPDSQAPPTAAVAGAVTVVGGGDAALTAVVMPEPAGAFDPDTTRRVALANGGFVFEGLPPGAWRVVIADTESLDAWPDAALLGRLRAASILVNLPAGQRVLITLTVTADAGVRRVAGVRMSRSSVVVAPRGRPVGALPPGGRGAPPGIRRGTGSIAGRVTAGGQPAHNVTVVALRPITRDGIRQLAPAGGPVETDADGRFVVAGLRAGDYAIAAFPDGLGRASLTGSQPTSNVPAPIPSEGRVVLAFTTTFHPSSPDPADAALVSVIDDETTTQVAIVLARASAVPVSGRITQLPADALLGGRVYLRPADVVLQLGGSNVRYGAVDLQGAFHFDAVRLGSYQLGLVAVREPTGEAAIRVDAELPASLEITLSGAVRIAGRVEYHGASPPADANLGVTISAFPSPLRPGSRITRTTVRPDGTFELSVSPGAAYRLEAESETPWRQVSGFVGGTDTLDGPLLIDAHRDDAMVVLSDRDTSVSGTVVDIDGRPAEDVITVVFPTDRRLWTPSSRRVRLLTPLPGAIFNATSLPPGTYFVVAGRGLAPGGRVNLAALEQDPSATRFTLSIGEQEQLTITVGGGAPR